MNGLRALGLGLLMATLFLDATHPSASDANAGTSASLPRLTLHGLTDGVPTRETGGSGGSVTPAAAGDTVWISQKSGVTPYEGTFQTANDTAEFNPSNTGSAGSPIVYRALAGHTPYVSRTDVGTSTENGAVIGGSQSYIEWYNLRITTGLLDACVVGSLNGMLLDGITIDKNGPITHTGAGEMDGIRMENSDNWTVRNCLISNVSWSEAFYNAAGIRVRNCAGWTIQNSEPTNCDCGVFVKDDAQSGVIEKCYITFSRTAASGGFNGVRLSTNGAGTSCSSIDVRQVIVYSNSPTPLSCFVYNPNVNTAGWTGNRWFNLVAYCAVAGSPVGHTAFEMEGAPGGLGTPPAWRMFNLIGVMPDGSSDVAKFANDTTDWSNVFLDYNVYRALSGLDAVWRYAGTAHASLAAWQAASPPLEDANSFEADPSWEVTPTGTKPTVTNFRLAAGSQFRSGGANPGRQNGNSGDAAVHRGAYLSDSDVIGIGAASAGKLVRFRRAA